MAIEQLFPTFKSERVRTNNYDPSDKETYESYLHTLFGDAEDYETSILAGDRSEAQLFFYGYSPGLDYTEIMGPYVGEDPTSTIGELLSKNDKNDTPNRSTFVSTDVRDAIMLMLPGLVRLFGASESPVFLVPRSEADSDMAEQATDYVNYVFWNDNPGFLILYGALKDALTVKTGFVKWWSDNQRQVRRKRFENITTEQLQLLLSEDPTAKLKQIGKLTPGLALVPPSRLPAAGAPGPIQGPQGAPPGGVPGAPPGSPPLGQSPGPMPGGVPFGTPSSPAPTYDFCVIEYEVSKPLIRVAGVPPEEMRLDRYARSFATSRFIGHERIVPIDEMIAMGYDREKVLENVQSSETSFTIEPQLRNPGRFMGTQAGDGVKYGEWYVKIDKDGDGQPELRYICTMGENRDIVLDEEANRIRFALFSCDPVAHTIVGDSLTDYIKDIQVIKTNMLRAILDSAAESINPKTVVNELMVTIDDAMNDGLGAVIRTRGDPNSSVMFANRPFLGQQILPLVELMNDVLARRTGLSDAAKGLDPKALQSSTMIGVEAVINGAQERIELVARVLCETGFKDLFTGLFNEVCENPNQQRTLKIRGKWVPYDTSTFDSSLTCEVNANLGKGSDMTRMLALNQIDQKQQLVVSQYGLNNPVCGVPEMLNTIADTLSLANVKNVGRYFKTPSPQQMQQILSQPKTPDAMSVAAQAQLEKVRSDTAKAVGQQDLARDRLQQELAFKHRQLHAKTTVDLEKIRVDSAKVGVDMQSQLAKDQADADAADQESQHKMAESQQQMDLKAQQQQQSLGLAQVKAVNDMNLAHQKAASAHEIGLHKVASQHVLGALAAQNQGDGS